MSHIFESVTGTEGALSFKFNGQFALKNYNVEIVNGNRLKVTSVNNEMFSLLEADVSEVEINGTIYSDSNAAQLALTSLVYSAAEPVVLTKEQYLQLASAVQAADRGKILPDTAVPSGGWQPGWYTPGLFENADPGTNYPNQNNLKAKKGFITKFLYNGVTWDSLAYEIPQATQKFVNIQDLRSQINVYNGSISSKNTIYIPISSTGSDTNISINLAYYGLGFIFRNNTVELKLSYRVNNVNLSGLSFFSILDGATETYHNTVISDDVVNDFYTINISDLNILQLMLIVNSKINPALSAYIELINCEINCNSLSDIEFKNFENQINQGFLQNILTVNKNFNSSTPDFGYKNFNSIIAAHDYIKGSSDLNRFTINVDDGVYDEFNEAFGGAVTAPTYVGILVKNRVDFIGNIKQPENCLLEFDGAYGLAPNTATEAELFKKCIFHLTHNENVYNVYNTYFPNRIRGFSMRTLNCRYCIHPETAGLGQNSYTELSDLILEFGFRPALAYLGSDKVVQGCQIGMGVTLGEKMEIKRVKCIKSSLATEYSYAINGHNNANSSAGTKPIPQFKRGSHVIIEDCDFGGLALGYECLANGDTFDFVQLKNLKNVHHTWFSYYGVPNTIKVEDEAVDAAIQFAP